MTTHARHDRKFVRALTLGVALIAVGVLAPAAAGADWTALDPEQTAEQRSIALIEGTNPANANAPVAAAWESLNPGQTASERSIALIEGSDPANFPVALADDAEFQPPTANARSIALIESKEAPDGILAGMPAPPARIPYTESEHAVAQNRVSVASQSPQVLGPHQSTA